VIFISYEAHIRFQPFVEHSDGNTQAGTSNRQLEVEGGSLPVSATHPSRSGTLHLGAHLYVRDSNKRQYPFKLILSALPVMIYLWQHAKHNTLETVYLRTSLFILLAGMTFQSGVAVEGSGSYLTLTYTVAIILVVSVAAFLTTLALEVRRSILLARSTSVTRHLSQIAPASPQSPI
jgi:hypothetical protein